MKGFFVLDLPIKFPDGFLEYAEKIPAFIEKYGGRYLSKVLFLKKMEGDWVPERLGILEFPSTEQAKEFLADPEAQDLFVAPGRRRGAFMAHSY